MNHMKPNYFIIPFATIAVSAIGSWITSDRLQWYRLSIVQPGWTPTGATIGFVWTVIYICAMIAALIAYNKCKPEERIIIVGLFVINAILNVMWSALFFGGQMIGFAAVETIALDVSVAVLIGKIWTISRIGAWLLVPYLAWGTFAAYLNYIIWTLNK